MTKTARITTTFLTIAALAMLSTSVALAQDIKFRSFSASAAIGPPAVAFADKLADVSQTTLGTSGQVRFTPIPGIPTIPAPFSGSIVAAVAAGEAGGGFDAAYVSGGDLNKTWGFLYNSGIPFGPTFDEFVGFLYGKSVDDGAQTGLSLVQGILDARRTGVVAVPIVGSPEQLSGYFQEPIADAGGHRGIGVAGLCERDWTLRYLPPAENILNIACDDLVAARQIRKKNLKFIQAVPGGGSLMDGVLAGTIQGFEFATPLDDLSQVFNTPDNPGTAGLRFVHVPGWQQQFLLTWMLVNRQVWDRLTAAQQVLVQTVARDHVVSSYGENLRAQGPALAAILNANKADADRSNDMVLSTWGPRDQAKLRDATIKFLNARGADVTLPANDRADYQRVLEALRRYVQANDAYWSVREVHPGSRFRGWETTSGGCWTDDCRTRRP